MPLIPVKTAVEASILYFQEVLSPTDIRLEEIELSDDERYWLVTLSALLPLKSDGFALPDLRTLRTAFGRTLRVDLRFNKTHVDSLV